MNRQNSASTLLSRHLGKATIIKTEQIITQRAEEELKLKRTKIVCTMGPACWDVPTLVQMIDAGMDVARLNFSHGDHPAHANTVKNLQAAMAQRPNKKIGLMLDTKGPEIRTGFFKDPSKNINLVAGQKLKITTDYEFKGDESCIACSYPQIGTSVSPGNKILIADGSLICEVLEIAKDHIITKVMNDASIGERKNMNLPGVKVQLPCLGEKEKHDVLNFCIPQGCDFIAASFVQSAQDVRDFRDLLGPRGRHVKIIPKIENVEGIVNFDEILDECDGIMVARGDMGMEIPPEKVFLAQKMMIAKCNIQGKPVITATQMLESMIHNPRPTRAEASDVANAVLDGTDCVMLSGESANGKNPVEAVKVLSRTVLEAESCIDYIALQNAIHASIPRPVEIQEGVSSAAVQAQQDTNAQLIIALTETGQTARLLAKYRPDALIVALSTCESTVKHLMMQRGVRPVLVPSFQGQDNLIKNTIQDMKKEGVVKSGNYVVAVHGVHEELPGGTNLMRVLKVD